MKNGSGTPTVTLDIGRPACSDGVDNDLDGATDSAGGDGQCTSAADANERLAGAQTFQPVTLPVDIDAAGAITYDPTDLQVQQVEQCFSTPELWCTGITIKGTGSTQTGSVSGSGVALPLPVVIEIDALVGFPGLPAGCQAGPLTGNFTASTYNETTGAAAFTAAGISIPAVTTCGDFNAAFNGFLGLPGTGEGAISTTVLNPDGDPIQVS